MLSKKHYNLKYASMFFSFSLFSLFFLGIDSLYAYLTTCFVFIYVCYAFGESFDSPLIWFSFIVILYGFSYLIVFDFGYAYIKNPEKIIYIVAVFLGSFQIGWAFFSKDTPSTGIKYYLSEKSIDITFYSFLSIVVIYLLWYILIFGGNKLEASLAGFNKLAIIFQWFSVAFSAKLIVYYVNGKSDLKFIIYMLLLSLLSSLVTGERDLFVSIFVTYFFVRMCYVRYNIFYIIILSSFVLLIFTILQNFRTLFSVENLDKSFEYPILIEILRSEPSSAGVNLDVLLSYLTSSDLYMASLFYIDLVSVFVPKFIFFFENAENWFNSNFFQSIRDIGGGVGFTLIGNFYLYGGYFSVAIGGFFVAYLLSFYYYRSRFGFYYLIFYSSLVVHVIYSMRSGVTALLGGPIRGIVPVMLVLYISSRFLKRV